MLCDRKIKVKLKRIVYKTVVRPATMCGVETWAVKKEQDKKLDVTEVRMLRWMCGVTTMDKMRNETMRRTTKVGEISNKVQERRLQWCVQERRRVCGKANDGAASGRSDGWTTSKETRGRLD